MFSLNSLMQDTFLDLHLPISRLQDREKILQIQEFQVVLECQEEDYGTDCLAPEFQNLLSKNLQAKKPSRVLHRMKSESYTRETLVETINL